MASEWKPVTLYRVGNESGKWALYSAPALQSRWQWRFAERTEATKGLLIANRCEKWRGFAPTAEEAIRYRLGWLCWQAREPECYPEAARGIEELEQLLAEVRVSSARPHRPDAAEGDKE